jgi:hypothetical protein
MSVVDVLKAVMMMVFCADILTSSSGFAKTKSKILRRWLEVASWKKRKSFLLVSYVRETDKLSAGTSEALAEILRSPAVLSLRTRKR